MAYHSAQPCLALKPLLKVALGHIREHFVLIKFVAAIAGRFGDLARAKPSVCSMSEENEDEIKEKKFETRNLR